MRKALAAFARSVGAAPVVVASQPVPHVPQAGNGLGNTLAPAETHTEQGLRAPVPHVPPVPRENKVPKSASGNDGARIAPAEPRRVLPSSPSPAAPIPAIEVAPAEYDRIANALIEAAGTGTNEAGRLTYMKKKGSVLPDGNRKIYVRGRC